VFDKENLITVRTFWIFFVMYFWFVDDLMFSHDGANGPESKMMHMFHQVHQVETLGTKTLSTIAGLLQSVLMLTPLTIHLDR